MNRSIVSIMVLLSLPFVSCQPAQENPHVAVICLEDKSLFLGDKKDKIEKELGLDLKKVKTKRNAKGIQRYNSRDYKKIQLGDQVLYPLIITHFDPNERLAHFEISYYLIEKPDENLKRKIINTLEDEIYCIDDFNIPRSIDKVYKNVIDKGGYYKKLVINHNDQNFWEVRYIVALVKDASFTESEEAEE